MKEKVYTFRNHKYVWGLGVTEEEVKAKLIYDELSRGYFPAEIRTQMVKANAITKEGVLTIDYTSIEPLKDYAVATCWSAYMGKKAARTAWEKNKFMEFPKISCPYSSGQ